MRLSTEMLLIVLLITVVVSSCKTVGDKITVDNTEVPFPPAGFIADLGKGFSLFHDKCSVCHGEKAMGSHQGPSLIHSIYGPSEHSDLSFYMAVTRGIDQHHWAFGSMSPVAGLSPEAVGHIIAYIRSEQVKAGMR